MDRTDPAPSPAFSRAEYSLLQELLDAARVTSLDSLLEALEDDHEAAVEELRARHKAIKELRNKVYHLNGRDTLALSHGAEQRHWDQRHHY